MHSATQSTALHHTAANRTLQHFNKVCKKKSKDSSGIGHWHHCITLHTRGCECVKHAPPTWCKHFGENPFQFQQDCAPVYKASFIKTCYDEFGLEELEWFAQSPENEHLLDYLEHWFELCFPIQHRYLITILFMRNGHTALLKSLHTLAEVVKFRH